MTTCETQKAHIFGHDNKCLFCGTERDTRELACYILDHGWELCEHRQDGEHTYRKTGAFGIGAMELRRAYHFQKGMEKLEAEWASKQ